MSFEPAAVLRDAKSEQHCLPEFAATVQPWSQWLCYLDIQWKLGYTCGKIYSALSPKSFMNTRLFQDWATQAFLPEMRESRATQIRRIDSSCHVWIRCPSPWLVCGALSSSECGMRTTLVFVVLLSAAQQWSAPAVRVRHLFKSKTMAVKYSNGRRFEYADTSRDQHFW